MMDFLTRFALVGAALMFAAWVVLANRRRIACAADALAKISRARIAAFFVFVAIATVCAQKPGGTNDPPQGIGNPLHLLHFLPITSLRFFLLAFAAGSFGVFEDGAIGKKRSSLTPRLPISQ